jgi:hypothetical protein
MGVGERGVGLLVGALGAGAAPPSLGPRPLRGHHLGPRLQGHELRGGYPDMRRPRDWYGQRSCPAVAWSGTASQVALVEFKWTFLPTPGVVMLLLDVIQVRPARICYGPLSFTPSATDSEARNLATYE